MKIASWNVNSLRVRLPHVLEWLSTSGADVLAIQETKTKDPDFPIEEFRAAGYEVAFAGQPTYNGVAVVAKGKMTDVQTDLENFDDPQRRVLGVTIGNIRLFNLYVPNGQSIESDKYGYKLDWLAALHSQLSNDIKRYPQCVVLGDFNIAPEDRDVHDPENWKDKVLCSAPERDALNKILELGFIDTYRQFEQADDTFSWWDYRAAAFRRNRGLRIDLILASKAMSASCRSASIDIEPRRWERPSDHTPVVAEFTIE